MTEFQRRLQELSGTKHDAVGAANAWAGTAGLELLEALNRKAGTDGLGLNAVVQKMTGGKREAAAELRRPQSGWNVALGRPVSFSQAGSSNPGVVTDGDTSSGSFGGGANGAGYAQVDLGSAQALSSVRVWHYYEDNRSYFGTRTEVSEDGTNWFNLFNSEVLGTELLANPSYETTPFGNGIGSVNAAVLTQAAGGVDGASRLTLTTDSATAVQGFNHMSPTGTSLTAGTWVRASVWLRGTTGQVVTVMGRAHDPNDTSFFSDNLGNRKYTLDAATWTKATIEFSTEAVANWRPGLQVQFDSAATSLVLDADLSSIVTTKRYYEKAAGRTYTFPSRQVRYIRDHLNGSTANTSNHWVEIQAAL